MWSRIFSESTFCPECRPVHHTSHSLAPLHCGFLRMSLVWISLLLPFLCLHHPGWRFIKGNLVIIKPKVTCRIIIWLSVFKTVFNQALLPIDCYLYCYAVILMVKWCNIQSWMCIVSTGQTVKRYRFKYSNTLWQTGFSSKRKWSTDNCCLTKSSTKVTGFWTIN